MSDKDANFNYGAIFISKAEKKFCRRKSLFKEQHVININGVVYLSDGMERVQCRRMTRIIMKGETVRTQVAGRTWPLHLTHNSHDREQLNPNWPPRHVQSLELYIIIRVSGQLLRYVKYLHNHRTFRVSISSGKDTGQLIWAQIVWAAGYLLDRGYRRSSKQKAIFPFRHRHMAKL